MSNLLKVYFDAKINGEWTQDAIYTSDDYLQDDITDLKKGVEAAGGEFVLLGVFDVEC